MKTMKKVLAFMLALAMVVTAVPVTNAEAATGLPKSKSYYAGKTYTLKLTTPSSWKSVSTVWSATNNNTKAVAISDKKTKSVTVKALKKGKAVVTAKVTYKKSGVKTTKTYKCNVRVKAPTIAITQKAITVDVDKTADITAKFVPASGIVSFESEDDNVAAVKDLGNGKAVVTGVTPGQSTNIKAYLRCGKKVKMSIVKVTVVGETLEDGLSVKVTNTSSVYENTVVSCEDAGYKPAAKVRVYYGKGGKGISGKTISLQANYNDVDTTGLGGQYAVTDANGFAYFDIANTGVAKVSLEAKVLATDVAATTKFEFANVSFSSVRNVNGIDMNNHKEYGVPYMGVNYVALGYKGLVPSANDVKGDKTGDATTVTDGIWTYAKVDGVHQTTVPVRMYDTEYVNSQQVSAAGTKDHQVGFIGGQPYITFPGEGSNINPVTSFEQNVGITVGAYHTNETNAQYVTLGVDPNELTYADLNFKNLQISEHTLLKISTWVDKAAAEAGRDAKKKVGTDTIVTGPHKQNTFSYQLPLQGNKFTTLCVKVEIISKGQVNVDDALGYEIVNITGKYRNKTQAINARTELIKNAKVEWSAVTPKYSEERELDNAVAALKLADGTDITVNAATKIAKVTYRVPVFPYTGNAIITTYDKNGKVIAYYACPTKNNSGKANAVNTAADKEYNVNVLDTDAEYVYKISEEEAFNVVGTFEQQETENGTLVTVNSEKAGTTSLMGKVTGLEGILPAWVYSYNEANSELYTSVQWNPVKNVNVRDRSGAIAFLGQSIEVIAQLVDKNGNAVSTSGERITFSYEKTEGVDTTITDDMTTLQKAGDGLVNPTVAYMNKVTDSKGQAKLTLKAALKTAVTGISASSKDYEVVIKVAGTDVKYADLYWINARPAFNACAEKDKLVDDTTVTSTTLGVDGLNPATGSTWEYGFTTAKETLTNAGKWAKAEVTINNAKIGLSVATGNVATVELNVKNGAAKMTSTKTGFTKLKGTVNGESVKDATISFGLAVPHVGWTENTGSALAGTGNANFSNTQTLEIQWGLAGEDAGFVSASGQKVVATSGNSTLVYFKVTDKNGNPAAGKKVFVSVDEGAEIWSISQATGTTYAPVSPMNGTNVEPSAASAWFTNGAAYGVSDKNGMVYIQVLRESIAATSRNIVTAKVADMDDQAFSTTIDWANAASAAVTIDDTIDPSTGSYYTRASEKTVVLTFKNDVVASRIDKKMFTVKYDGSDEVEVTNVEVAGRQVILTLAYDKAKDNVAKPYHVTIDHKNIDGYVYCIQSVEDGSVLSDGKTYKVYAKEEKVVAV